MKMKIFLDSVGCRLNQSEIEKLAGQFVSAGHQIVDDAGQADIVIINTCAVTSAASSDSRQKIRQAARRGAGRIIPTGCWATIDLQEAARLPSVEQVFPNSQKDDIFQQLTGSDPTTDSSPRLTRVSLPGQHKRTRAFIKVQDGCDHVCSYCITRIARGRSRSCKPESISADVQSAIAAGVKEVVLTGAQLGAWGRDLNPSLQLRDLIIKIFSETSIPRLRLSSIEPWEINDQFLNLFEDSRLCRHLHIPMQSGSSAVLKRMQRPMSPDRFGNLVKSIKRVDENIAITTDLIVGFPGETEQEFSETVEVVREIHFAGGHVFSFSPRPQTLAAKFPGQVSSLVKKERSRILRGILADYAFNFRQEQKGHLHKVLWEKMTPVA
jgi:threonylcarbamoyladenosine tRNA methylthiotransferase MtaB